MLIDIDTGRTLAQIPYGKQFEQMRRRLTDVEFDAIVERINQLIDEAGGKIATAGWLPGNDWTGTPFEPIYSKAAARNQAVGARFFGQLVWYTIMHRPERWGSGRYEKGGVEIGSRTYFQVVDQ